MISTEEVERRFALQRVFEPQPEIIHSQEPIVSVWVVTYQHKLFIRSCLDGILSQKTNFKFEIVVGEDGSTDGTREICIEYALKYPSLIRLFLRDRDLTVVKNEHGQFVKSLNGIFTARNCRGKYIAFCDGDDFWVDPFKLQKQFDFLESNPSYSVSCHNAIYVNPEGEDQGSEILNSNEARDYTSEELIRGPWLLTPTMFIRNVYSNYPIEAYYVQNGDYFLTAILGAVGSSKFQKEIQPSRYRVHEGGVWSMKTDFEKWNIQINTYLYLIKYFARIKRADIKLHFLDLYYKKQKGVIAYALDHYGRDYADTIRKKTLSTIWQFSSFRIYISCHRQLKQLFK